MFLSGIRTGFRSKIGYTSCIFHQHHQHHRLESIILINFTIIVLYINEV
ncbi:hypothetical protein DERF_000163 [Dermatophagoides farinae]|uniref:Uncharacterized protein n=1 Tax=Dermatophagoides farinae TaxID=6954 RepID=A0A922L803_DERFA|nr:hypothetical protein DERF_000163 [Dermatophagoides farinae]